jgi:uncharacterized protein YegL
MKKLGFIIGLLYLYTVLCFAQQPIDDHIDKAVSKAVDYLESCFPRQARIALVNDLSDEAAEALFNKLEIQLVNRRNYRVVIRDPKTLNLIEKELNFQYSGEVSDETLASLGKKLGAQYIVFFSVKPQGGIRYLFHLRAVTVETAEMVASQEYYFQRQIKILGQVMSGYRLMQIAYNETPEAIQPGDVYIELGFAVNSEINIEKLPPAIIQAVPSSKEVRKNICFVIDKSGSMEGWKLEWVKREFKRYFAENIREQDFVSVVAFNDKDDPIIEPMQIKSETDREFCINKIDELGSGGNTMISEGLRKGYDFVKEYKREGYTNVVILLTDGISNDKKAVEDLVARHKNDYNIGTIALGDVVDTSVKDFMTRVAALGGGFSLFVDEQNSSKSMEKELDLLIINTSAILDNETYQLDIRLTGNEGVIFKNASEENTGWNQDVAYYNLDITGREYKTIWVKAQVDEKSLQTGSLLDLEITGDIPSKRHRLSLISLRHLTTHDKTSILSVYKHW